MQVPLRFSTVKCITSTYFYTFFVRYTAPSVGLSDISWFREKQDLEQAAIDRVRPCSNIGYQYSKYFFFLCVFGLLLWIPFHSNERFQSWRHWWSFDYQTDPQRNSYYFWFLFHKCKINQRKYYNGILRLYKSN